MTYVFGMKFENGTVCKCFRHARWIYRSRQHVISYYYVRIGKLSDNQRFIEEKPLILIRRNNRNKINSIINCVYLYFSIKPMFRDLSDPMVTADWHGKVTNSCRNNSLQCQSYVFEFQFAVHQQFHASRICAMLLLPTI